MTNKELIEKLKQFPSEKEVLLSILPYSTKMDDLIRCGTYGVIGVEEGVEEVSGFIVISNHT